MKKRTIPHLQCRTDARVRNRLAQKNREPDAQPMVDVTDEMIVTRLTDDMKFRRHACRVQKQNRRTPLVVRSPPDILQFS